jgi:hypothetical protein
MKITKRIILALFCVQLMNFCACASERTIEPPASYGQSLDAAASYAGMSDAAASPYFPKLDFFDLQSNEKGLSVISGFKTYQQTTETTCGPSCALMVLTHYGDVSFDERGLAKSMGTLDEMADDGQIGTSTAKMVKFFKDLGWQVQSSLASADETGDSFASPAEMRDFFVKNIRAGAPVMVENMYYGGHWRVVIGYDTMNTPQTADDVLLFADPYDVNDQQQNGYMVENAESFFFTWLDVGMLPEDESSQQWLIARPAGK